MYIYTVKHHVKVLFIIGVPLYILIPEINEACFGIGSWNLAYTCIVYWWSILIIFMCIILSVWRFLLVNLCIVPILFSIWNIISSLLQWMRTSLYLVHQHPLLCQDLLRRIDHCHNGYTPIHVSLTTQIRDSDNMLF